MYEIVVERSAERDLRRLSPDLHRYNGAGSLENIARMPHSYTGQYLAPMLGVGIAEEVGAAD